MAKAAWRRGLAAIAAVAVVSGIGAAEPEKGAPPEGAPPVLSPEFEAWMKAASPGEHHKHLEAFVGTWDAKVKYFPAPGAPPEETSGTSESRWVLGGRFIESRFTGTAMGQPFSGLGYSGYDNVAKKHTAVWMDTLGTAMVSYAGSCEDDGKVIRSTGEFFDPMSGSAKKTRGVARVLDGKTYTYEEFGPGPDGAEYKMLEIVYTRR